jgi:hypothetical protein
MIEKKPNERTFEVVLELRYIDTRGTVIRDGIVIAGGFEEAMALYRRMLDASRPEMRKGAVMPEKLCAHRTLVNRGSPPNTSNQRICEACGKKFGPPVVVGGICEADDGQRVHDQ